MTSVDSQGSRLRSGLGEVLRFYGGTLHYHVGLLVFGAALVAPVFGAGEGLGVPHLYLHDDFGKQCVSGLAVGLVYFHIGILAFVLANGHKPKEGSKPPTLVVWELLGWSLGPPALVLAIVPWVRGGAPHDGVAWLTGVAWSIGITLLILFGSEITVLSELIKTWFGRLKPGDSKASSGWWTEVKERIREIPSGNDKLSYVRAACVGFSLLLLLGWMVLSAIGMFWPKAEVFWILPAAVPFAVTLAFWASVYSVLRFLIRRLTIPLLVGVLLFALVSIVRFPCATAMPNNCANATDEQKCEDDWEAARSMAEATAPEKSELASDTEALQAHLANDGPLVIITTSGGGARSAAWTTAILARLEQPMAEGGLDPEFFRHVRLITGASGGMVGASFWVAELVDADQRGGPKPCGRTTFEKATKGSLSGPFARLLLLTGRNRGEALERAWEHHAPALEIPFRSLEELEQAGKIPSLVFAPMIVEDASQMLFSNLDLGWYALADGPEPVDYVCPRRVEDDDDVDVDSAKAQIRCPSARQFFARVPGDQVKLSTLARVSAAFPYMSPAVTLPFAEEPRAVDAGYYDNYGTRLATAWITHHVLTCRESKSPGCLTSEGRPVLLLELRDHDPRDWSVPNWQWKHELTSPVEGLLNGRVHVALHRNSDAVARLEHLLGKDAVFAHVVLQFEGEAALSWELTNADREEIWDAAHALQLRELAAWWTRYGVSSESDLDAASDCSSISGPSFWPTLRAQATH